MNMIVHIILLSNFFGPTALAADPSGPHLDRVISLVEMNKAIYLKEILSSPGINEDLGRKSSDPLDGGFKYNIAYQAAYIKGNSEELHESFTKLIKNYQRLIIPLCHKRSCILCRFNFDAKNNKVELSSYGSNLEAARIAQGHQRLQEMKPGYDGPIDIVGYPDNNYEFLLINDQNDGEKKLFPVTDQQAQSIYYQLKDSDEVTPAMRAIEQVNELSPVMMAEVMRRTKEAAEEISQESESFESTATDEGSVGEDEESQIVNAPISKNIENVPEVSEELHQIEKDEPEHREGENTTNKNQTSRLPLLLLAFGLAASIGIWLVRKK